jgi:hypothetical protein
MAEVKNTMTPVALPTNQLSCHLCDSATKAITSATRCRNSSDSREISGGSRNTSTKVSR